MRSATRLTPFLLAASLCGADRPAENNSYPPAGEIIEKAVAWAKWHEQQNFHREWTFEHSDTVRHLDDSGETKSTEARLYVVYPLAGEQFYELTRDNGAALSPAEQRKQARRKREFIEQAEKKAADRSGNDEEDDGLKFNQELVSRYRAEVAGIESVDRRTAYVVDFEPKSGALPARHRYDQVMNKSRGKIWIDRDTFAVLRVEFELTEPVRLWAGLLGSVSRLRGRLTLSEIGGGAWHYKTMDLYLKGRILIKPFHQDRRLEWKNFRRVSVSPAGQ